MQNFFQTGYDGEIRQGTTLADAARMVGVEHFVYSSVGSAYRDTGISHFETKWLIEEHVRNLGLPYTILRLDFFMHNWEGMRQRIFEGVLEGPLAPRKPLQQLAVDDLGAFAAMAATLSTEAKGCQHTGVPRKCGSRPGSSVRC